MSDEIEIKLALSPEAPARLANHPALQRLESRTLSLSNQYYDTPDAELESRRVALRVRRQGNEHVQTLKSAAQSRGGLSSRGEWEWPIDAAERNAVGLDLAGLQSLSHPALAGSDLERLAPVFATDFERRLWRYRNDDCEIEIALDQGEIVAAARRLPICELELELKQGMPAQLWTLAAILCQFDDITDAELPARPANHSKASRAAHLRHGWSQPAAIATPTLDTLIDAIDNWQDSEEPAWQASAAIQCETLIRTWPIRCQQAGRRLLADIQSGRIPWRGRDWLNIRHELG